MIPYWPLNYLHGLHDTPNHVYTGSHWDRRLHDQSAPIFPQDILGASGQRTTNSMVTWIFLIDIDVQPFRRFTRITSVNSFLQRSTRPFLISISYRWPWGTTIIIILVIMRKVATLSGISDVPYQISYEWEYLGLVLSSQVIPILWTHHNPLDIGQSPGTSSIAHSPMSI